MVTISFPGLGIEPFTLESIAFTIPVFGGISVRWYGIIITSGIILAFLYAWHRSKREGIILDDLLDMAIYTVLIAMVGARTYYVLFDIIGNGNAAKYTGFLDYIAIWEGGIAIYGAIIGGALSLYVVSKVKKLKWQKCFDMVAPGVMIGQILGRWGNFFNGEAYGALVEEGHPLYFMRMGLCSSHTVMDFHTSELVNVHPTFLYESLWNLVGFLLINAFYKKKRFDGEVFLWYITWYGFGRMFIEGLRTDSLYIGGMRVSQLLGAACFIVGATLIIVFEVRARRAGSRPIFAGAATAAAGAESSYSALLADDDATKAEPTDRNDSDNDNNDTTTAEENDNGDID